MIPSHEAKRSILALLVVDCYQTVKVIVDINKLNDDHGFPASVLEQFFRSLPLDINPRYPLNLYMDEDVMSADLAFGSGVFHCTIPWAAVAAIAVGVGGVWWEHEEPVESGEPATTPANVVRGPWEG